MKANRKKGPLGSLAVDTLGSAEDGDYLPSAPIPSLSGAWPELIPGANGADGEPEIRPGSGSA